MELKIYERNPQEEIKWNNEELKAEIAEKVKDYKNLVYTDNQIKDAKADRARLNKLVKALEDKRKEVKKECLQPYEKFESQIKEVIAIVNEPIVLIDTQVKEYEELKRNEKYAEIEKMFEEKNIFDWLDLKAVFDEKWLNASKNISRVEVELDEIIAKIDSDIRTLQSLKEFAFEAIEEYKHSLDISRAIAEGQRLAEIQRRKEEAKKEEEARKAEEQAKQEQAEIEKGLPFNEPEVVQIENQQAEETMKEETEPKKRKRVVLEIIANEDNFDAINEFYLVLVEKAEELRIIESEEL